MTDYFYKARKYENKYKRELLKGGMNRNDFEADFGGNNDINNNVNNNINIHTPPPRIPDTDPPPHIRHNRRNNNEPNNNEHHNNVDLIPINLQLPNQKWLLITSWCHLFVKYIAFNDLMSLKYLFIRSMPIFEK